MWGDVALKVDSNGNEYLEFSVRLERLLFRDFREIFQNWPFGEHKTRNFAK